MALVPDESLIRSLVHHRGSPRSWRQELAANAGLLYTVLPSTVKLVDIADKASFGK